MKKLIVFLIFLSFMLTAIADWSYGTARFRGNQPTSSMSYGDVKIWYNGTLKQTGVQGNTLIWEGTGNICVVFPKNYSGRQMRFYSSGGTVQIEYLK